MAETGDNRVPSVLGLELVIPIKLRLHAPEPRHEMLLTPEQVAELKAVCEKAMKQNATTIHAADLAPLISVFHTGTVCSRSSRSITTYVCALYGALCIYEKQAELEAMKEPR